MRVDVRHESISATGPDGDRRIMRQHDGAYQLRQFHSVNHSGAPQSVPVWHRECWPAVFPMLGRRHQSGHDMSKQAQREEAERLIREAMEKKALSVTKGNTRVEATCGKCGAKNRVQLEAGETRGT